MILLDGQPSDSILLQDRGLAYGDGLFETIAVRDGQLLSWAAHMARLLRGCTVLALLPPDTAQLLDEARQLAHGRACGIIKIILTRGFGGRGYRPSLAPHTRRILAWHEWPEDLALQGTMPVNTWLCRTRLGFNPQLAGIKHLNRLEQVLASAEWPAPHYFEGLMRDLDDMLVEGTRSNLFIVRQDTLLTPDLKRCGVAGIVRQAVIDAAPVLGLDVRVAPLPLATLDEADEVFICNAVIGIRVVASIADDEGIRTPRQRGIGAEFARYLRASDVIP